VPAHASRFPSPIPPFLGFFPLLRKRPNLPGPSFFLYHGRLPLYIAFPPSPSSPGVTHKHNRPISGLSLSHFVEHCRTLSFHPPFALSRGTSEVSVPFFFQVGLGLNSFPRFGCISPFFSTASRISPLPSGLTPSTRIHPQTFLFSSFPL